MTKKRGKAVALILILLFAILSVRVISVSPSGGGVNQISSERAPADSPGSIPAQAGNVTELNIFGYTTTQTWQGYFGNVTGTIQLADASDRVIYNWSLVDPEGEIYASTNNSITWTKVQCFNYTATGNLSNNDTGEIAGATNLFGMNLSQLESQYGLAYDDVDGVNETFTLFNHETFFTSNLQFSANECRSTRVFGSTGAGVDQEFEEILLYDPMTTSVVFVSLIEKNLLGFDQRTHDFEMLVLENGHATDTSTTTYYFFVELE